MLKLSHPWTCSERGQDRCSEEGSQLETDLSYHDGVFTDAMGMKEVPREGLRREADSYCVSPRWGLEKKTLAPSLYPKFASPEDLHFKIQEEKLNPITSMSIYTDLFILLVSGELVLKCLKISSIYGSLWVRKSQNLCRFCKSSRTAFQIRACRPQAYGERVLAFQKQWLKKQESLNMV